MAGNLMRETRRKYKREPTRNSRTKKKKSELKIHWIDLTANKRGQKEIRELEES